MSHGIVNRGAEAVIKRGKWHGRDVMIKERLAKSYRLEELDTHLRNSRTKREASLMAEARESGILTPRIFDIDVPGATIVMEAIEGELAKDFLQKNHDRDKISEKIGQAVGRMHANDIIHGDLTTSNMIVKSGEIYFIDFGLGEISHEAEKKGVDLHLLKEALDSAHSEFPELFDAVSCGYLEAYTGGKDVLAVVGEIAKRGRYS